MSDRRWADVDPAVSRAMSLVRSKGTRPEMLVRRLAHAMGYRFRLHRKDLPGTPDLVFPSRQKVIFINGCFWHGHSDPGCRLARLPKTRVEFWMAKIERNVERDARSEQALQAARWDVMTIWECQTRAVDRPNLERRLCVFLGPARKP